MQEQKPKRLVSRLYHRRVSIAKKSALESRNPLFPLRIERPLALEDVGERGLALREGRLEAPAGRDSDVHIGDRVDDVPDRSSDPAQTARDEPDLDTVLRLQDRDILRWDIPVARVRGYPPLGHPGSAGPSSCGSGAG